MSEEDRTGDSDRREPVPLAGKVISEESGEYMEDRWQIEGPERLSQVQVVLGTL